MGADVTWRSRRCSIILALAQLPHDVLYDVVYETETRRARRIAVYLPPHFCFNDTYLRNVRRRFIWTRYR